MRVFAPVLICAALFSFTARAEDAPLPFDVPSAAPAIVRPAAVNKPVSQPAPVRSRLPVRTARALRLKNRRVTARQWLKNHPGMALKRPWQKNRHVIQVKRRG